MPSWVLFLEVFFVWSLWPFASLFSLAVEDARSEKPKGRVRVDTMPDIPLLPLMFWSGAKVVDGVSGTSWGTVVTGWLHVVLFLAFSVWIFRNWQRLRSFKNSP
jgi:hypothetical protein